jgi:hypothetical protein
MKMKLASINLIREIEHAYTVGGCPTLGKALHLLLERLNNNICDSETLGRALFLSWYSSCEPVDLTGLSSRDYPSPEVLLLQYSQVYLDADIEFMMGLIAYYFPDCFGDENKWQKDFKLFFVNALAKSPSSDLFNSWKYFIGEVSQFAGSKTALKREIVARFDGRGYMGDYITHRLITQLNDHDKLM